MDDKIKPENINACYMCLATTNLIMYVYKHKGKRVGFIFLCEKCFPGVKKKKMRIILEG